MLITYAPAHLLTNIFVFIIWITNLFFKKEKKNENFAIVHEFQHGYTTELLECWCIWNFLFYPVVYGELSCCGCMIHFYMTSWRNSCSSFRGNVNYELFKKNRMNKPSSGAYLTFSLNWKWYSTYNAPYS